jgi:hypothetical protein
VGFIAITAATLLFPQLSACKTGVGLLNFKECSLSRSGVLVVTAQQALAITASVIVTLGVPASPNKQPRRKADAVRMRDAMDADALTRRQLHSSTVLSTPAPGPDQAPPVVVDNVGVLELRRDGTCAGGPRLAGGIGNHLKADGGCGGMAPPATPVVAHDTEDSWGCQADRDNLLASLPARVPRDEAARLVTRYFFKVSPRSLERWPLRWRHLNGRAHVDTAELFAYAAKIVAAAPPIMGGRQRAADKRT